MASEGCSEPDEEEMQDGDPEDQRVSDSEDEVQSSEPEECENSGKAPSLRRIMLKHRGRVRHLAFYCVRTDDEIAEEEEDVSPDNKAKLEERRRANVAALLENRC
jgi:hypothetical protein